MGVRFTSADLNCLSALTSIDIIVVFFSGVDYFLCAVFDTITQKLGRKSSKLNESAETIALV